MKPPLSQMKRSFFRLDYSPVQPQFERMSPFFTDDNSVFGFRIQVYFKLTIEIIVNRPDRTEGSDILPVQPEEKIRINQFFELVKGMIQHISFLFRSI